MTFNTGSSLLKGIAVTAVAVVLLLPLSMLQGLARRPLHPVQYGLRLGVERVLPAAARPRRAHRLCIRIPVGSSSLVPSHCDVPGGRVPQPSRRRDGWRIRSGIRLAVSAGEFGRFRASRGLVVTVCLAGDTDDPDPAVRLVWNRCTDGVGSSRDARVKIGNERGRSQIRPARGSELEARRSSDATP